MKACAGKCDDFTYRTAHSYDTLREIKNFRKKTFTFSLSKLIRVFKNFKWCYNNYRETKFKHLQRRALQKINGNTRGEEL